MENKDTQNPGEALSVEQQKQQMYNAVYHLTEASKNLQMVNGMFSFSILSQANIVLSHLKYLETGSFDPITNNPFLKNFYQDTQVNYSQNNVQAAPIPEEVKEEIDALAEEFKDILDLD